MRENWPSFEDWLFEEVKKVIMTRQDMISATKAANKAKLKSQTVTIDQDWKIRRVDPLNWEIQYKGEGKGYFPTVSGAIKALPSKMLNEQAKGDLADVLRSVDSIREMIDKAIP